MKILVVDDHPIVRDGLRRLLAGEPGLEVREAASGREALTAFREYRPDLVVLDLSMPGMGGLEVIGRLKLENPAVRILVLSMHQEAIYATRALQAGAIGFISKNAPADRLLEAMKRVAGGHAFIEHEIAQELALANIRTAGVAVAGFVAAGVRDPTPSRRGQQPARDRRHDRGELQDHGQRVRPDQGEVARGTDRQSGPHRHPEWHCRSLSVRGRPSSVLAPALKVSQGRPYQSCMGGDAFNVDVTTVSRGARHAR
jgi:DNA-binding NarL/FixJ family response regulator